MKREGSTKTKQDHGKRSGWNPAAPRQLMFSTARVLGPSLDQGAAQPTACVWPPSVPTCRFSVPAQVES